MSANSKSASVADVLKLRPCVSSLVPVIAEGRCGGRSYLALPSGKALLEAAQASKQGNHLTAFAASVEAACYSAWNTLGTLTSVCDGDPKTIINPLRSGILTALALILVLFAFVGLLIQCDTLSWLTDEKTLLAEAPTIADYKKGLSNLLQTKHSISEENSDLIAGNELGFYQAIDAARVDAESKDPTLIPVGSRINCLEWRRLTRPLVERNLRTQIQRDFEKSERVNGANLLKVDGEVYDAKNPAHGTVCSFLKEKFIAVDPSLANDQRRLEKEVIRILFQIHQGAASELFKSFTKHFSGHNPNLPGISCGSEGQGYEAEVNLKARKVVLGTNVQLRTMVEVRSPQSGKFRSSEVTLGKVAGKIEIDLIANKAITSLRVTEVTN